MLRVYFLHAALLSALLVQAHGAELVHFRSGFDLEAQSHTLAGVMYAFDTPTGTIEVPVDEVVQIDSLAPETPAAAVPEVPPALDIIAALKSISMAESGTPEFSRFVRCVAEVESALNPAARSAKGASGIMQLMPGTAKELGVTAADIRDNIRGGAKYLRQLLADYHGDAVLALAAYNAGPSAVKKYGGVPPYAETRLYIRRVLQEYSKLERTSARN